MLNIENFLQFVESKPATDSIHNYSWKVCAVGEYLASNDIKINSGNGEFHKIVSEKYQNEVEQFSFSLYCLSVNPEHLNERGGWVEDDSLLAALNESCVDTYGQLADILKDAMNK